MVSATMRRVAADETHLSEDRSDPDEQHSRFARSLPAFALGSFALYPLISLVLLPEGTGHIQALSTHPDEYRTRVLSVFDGALLAR